MSQGDRARGPDAAGEVGSDVRVVLGARIATAVEEELAAALGEDVARELVRDALAGGATMPVDPGPLRVFVEGALRATLIARAGEDVAREALDRLAPLVSAWARIDEHHRSERPTSRPKAGAPQWTVIVGPERAWAVDRLAEVLGDQHRVALANEPADLVAIAEAGATDRVLLFLDRAQRWGGKLVYPPHWSAVLAPSSPGESLEEIVDAVRRLAVVK